MQTLGWEKSYHELETMIGKFNLGL